MFISIAQVIEGYPLNYEIQRDDAPKSKNLCGSSKAFDEDSAVYFAHQKGLYSFLVRIVLLTTLVNSEPLRARDMSVFLSHRDATDLYGSLHPHVSKKCGTR